MMRLLLGGLLAATAMAVTPASATQFVTNGNFSTTSATSSRQMSSDGSPGTTTQYVSGWTNANTSGNTAGYNFIVFSGQGTTAGGIQSNDNGPLYFWGKYSDDANAASNGFTGSDSIGGSGGNYLAADGAYEQSLIYQMITGLTVGQQYDLTFNWAGAQQHGYSGSTTDNWTAYLGTDTNNYQSYTTTTLTDVEHGFTGWQKASTTFTATSATETLAFLAHGTPDGQPPFSLLDDVSLTEHVASVPEPASWAMMIGGFGLIGATLRRRRGASVIA